MKEGSVCCRTLCNVVDIDAVLLLDKMYAAGHRVLH